MRVEAAMLALVAMTISVAVSCSSGSSTIGVAPDTGAATQESVAALPVADYEPYIDRTSFRVSYRRLTESQYRNSIAATFGPDVNINARFEPERREEGLQAIGNARLSITTGGLEQYLSVARSIADQVVDGDGRDRAVGCAPDTAEAEACALRFIKQVGRQLFRRPLSQTEIDLRLASWREGFEQSADFDKSLKLSLVSLLVAPEFLFRVESAETDPASPGGHRLDAWSRASRISFLLWDQAPDAELLAAASNGDLHTEEGLARQVERLIAAPQFEQGVRAFFTDMLQFEAFDTLTKDSATYPKFSQAVADSAREETLKFLVEHLVRREADYRDIFTTRDSVINRTLAAVYNVPYPSREPWTQFTFPEETDRSGIITQVSFLSLHSHPGSSSPTIRGVKLHEIFLCVPTPEPPADVDFSKVQASAAGTVRTRLIEHMTNPGCASCHMLSDPAGLSLERFDGLGQSRMMENGELIDVSADIGGRKFSGARGLGEYLRDSPLTTSCLVRNAHYYGVGRTPTHTEQAYLSRQGEAFAAGGYRMAGLFKNILTDPHFFNIVSPAGVTPKPATIAAASQSFPRGESR